MSNESNKLSRKIFSTVLAFTLVVVGVLSVALTCTYYFAYEKEYSNQLQAQTNAVAQYLNGIQSPTEADMQTCSQLSQGARVTLIGPKGSVIYDSSKPPSEMESHANRPEYRQALDNGASTVVRHSLTTSTDMLYSAVRLDSGNVVRLSEDRASLVAFLGKLAWPFVAVIAVSVILVLLLSRILAKRIMKPIDALDFSEPLDNQIYREMEPLLVRIDEQQQLLKAQNEELARAESMRRDFSANVSHEMKTPLQVISGYSELMKEGMVSPEDVPRFSEIIYNESQSMGQLVKDVLALSKLDEVPFDREAVEKVDVLAVCRSMAERLGGLARRSGVSLSVEGEGACILGDQTLVDEMVYNLIENGIRYNREGGSVAVSVHAIEGKAVLKVSDTGIGIPEDARDKVFERFFRVEKSRSRETGGTGLGLAIVKHAVLYHRGDIQLESKPGIGTTFTLIFPLA